MIRVSLATIIVAIAALSPALARQTFPGDVTLVVLRNAEGVANAEVRLDGTTVGTTDSSGSIRFRSATGLHRVVVSNQGATLAVTEFRLDAPDAAEIAVALGTEGRGTSATLDVFDPASSAAATISGAVRDAAGAPLAGVVIATADATDRTTTDSEGAFSLSVPRGSYALKVDAGARGTQQVDNVIASPLLSRSLALTLVPEAPANSASTATQLGTVVVTGRYQRDSAVQRERLSTSVIDAVSQEEIAAAGDSNASDALQRVTGLSVQDDVVVVRGLGDRYSTTLVNGAEIPSFNPSRRVVSADVFPSEFIGGITVQKTYSANLPGDFSGGVALIETRPVPDYRTGSIRLKVGGNTQTTFSPVLTYRGSGTDYLGFDAGRRDLPATFDRITNGRSIPLNQVSQADRGLLLQSLPDLFDLRRIDDAPVDFGGSLSYGDVYKLGGTQKLGFQIAGLYDTDFRFRREQRAEFQSVGGSAVAAREREELQRSEQSFDTGGTLGIGYEFDNRNKLEFVSLLSRQTQKGAFFGRVADLEQVLDQQRVTLDYVEGQLLTNQLTGTHKLDPFGGALGGLGIEWQFGYSTADRNVRDRRTYEYSRTLQSGANPEPFALALGAANEGVEPRRSFEDLSDTTIDSGASFTLPVSFSDYLNSDFELGFRITRRDRDFDSVRLGYNSRAGQRSDLFQSVRLAPSPESILIPLFFGDGGFDLIEVNSVIAQGGNANIYTASQDNNAVYALASFYLGSQFEIRAGARFENSTIDVLTGDPALGATQRSKLDDSDVLPSLNATWFLSHRQQLRLGISQTVNRPQFRELTPVEFLDPDTRFLTAGNPNLRSAKLDNYDLRYEFYWSATKAASIAAFYKDLSNPIEFNIGSTSGGDPLRSFSNARSAFDYGLEFDGRYDFSILQSLSPLLSHLYVAGNVSLIKSQATLADGSTRRLQGQSEYLVNTTLGYSNATTRTDAALLFNISGDRIAEVGFSGLPNAIEESVPVLDLNLRQGFGPSWQLGLKFRNLLDPRIRIRQGNGIQRAYELGVSGELSVRYQF